MAHMEMIEIPREVPVMTLSGTVLFPQAILPLHIFEPRYREMLAEVLSGNRIFAIAALDERKPEERDREPPRPIAGIGIVRACKKNSDGTSNLILQGLARVAFESITAESPFRRARIRQCFSRKEGDSATIDAIRSDILELVRTQIRLGAEVPSEVVQFLAGIEDSEAALDLAIASLCGASDLRQQLLETFDLLERHRLFTDYLKEEIEQLKLDRKLKGDLDDDDLSNN